MLSWWITTASFKFSKSVVSIEYLNKSDFYILITVESWTSQRIMWMYNVLQQQALVLCKFGKAAERQNLKWSLYPITVLQNDCFITMFLMSDKILLRRSLSASIYLFLTSSFKLSIHTEYLHCWLTRFTHTTLFIWAFAVGIGYSHTGLSNPIAKGSLWIMMSWDTKCLSARRTELMKSSAVQNLC